MSLGLRLWPGIRPSQCTDRPAINKMKQGALLELRLPDGTRRSMPLQTYGIRVQKDEDGGLLMYDNPRILNLPYPSGRDTRGGCTQGTEVWLLD